MTVLYPDSEQWLTGAIRAALKAAGREAYVDIQVPSPRRDRMVIVRRDGGPEGVVLATQRFGIRVFGKTEKDATDTADLTAALLRGLRFTGPARNITTTSPFAGEDPSDQPLRYLTAEIAVRGDALTKPI